MGQLRESIKALEYSLTVSEKLGDSHGDVETFGALGDMCSQLGNLEDAGKVSSSYQSPMLLHVPNWAYGDIHVGIWLIDVKQNNFM